MSEHSPSASELYDLGASAAGRHDMAAARRWWEEAAALGDAAAMRNLGYLAQQSGDLQAARDWYRRAADYGHDGAMNDLGFLAQEDQDWEQARHWWQRAAGRGNSYAMYSLGLLSRREGDRDAAAHWFEKAAADIHTDAMIARGDMLLEDGNVDIARRWYQLAANRGAAEALPKLRELEPEPEHEPESMAGDIDPRTRESHVEAAVESEEAALSRLQRSDTTEWNDYVARRRDTSGHEWGVDLAGAPLAGANLRGFDLRNANLRGADLRNAILREVDLHSADLTGADLGGVDLRAATMTCALMDDANLIDAKLTGADLISVKINSRTQLFDTQPHELTRMEVPARQLRPGDFLIYRHYDTYARVVAVTNISSTNHHSKTWVDADKAVITRIAMVTLENRPTISDLTIYPREATVEIDRPTAPNHDLSSPRPAADSQASGRRWWRRRR